LATHSEDQISALPDKLFIGTRREVDGEGDRATAGGETQTTPSSQWPMFRDGIIEGFRSDQKDRGLSIAMQNTGVMNMASTLP